MAVAVYLKLREREITSREITKRDNIQLIQKFKQWPLLDLYLVM